MTNQTRWCEFITNLHAGDQCFFFFVPIIWFSSSRVIASTNKLFADLKADLEVQLPRVVFRQIKRPACFVSPPPSLPTLSGLLSVPHRPLAATAALQSKRWGREARRRATPSLSSSSCLHLVRLLLLHLLFLAYLLLRFLIRLELNWIEQIQSGRAWDGERRGKKKQLNMNPKLSLNFLLDCSPSP